MNNTIVITDDGSHTLVSEQFGVGYHSLRGSIQESQTVFIDAGLKYFTDKKQEIHILEMGFGTGLNAIMSAQVAHALHKNIFYTGIEAFPISPKVAEELNFLSYLHADANLYQVYHELHSHQATQSLYFNATVNHILVQEFNTDKLFDLIYYDAFAPTSQEELWSVEMMQKMYDLLYPEGVLVTYCAKGQFKRNLKSVGFRVESLPGPVGKREMTRAIKPLNNQN